MFLITLRMIWCFRAWNIRLRKNPDEMDARFSLTTAREKNFCFQKKYFYVSFIKLKKELFSDFMMVTQRNILFCYVHSYTVNRMQLLVHKTNKKQTVQSLLKCIKTKTIKNTLRCEEKYIQANHFPCFSYCKNIN